MIAQPSPFTMNPMSTNPTTTTTHNPDRSDDSNAAPRAAKRPRSTDANPGQSHDATTATSMPSPEPKPLDHAYVDFAKSKRLKPDGGSSGTAITARNEIDSLLARLPSPHDDPHVMDAVFPDRDAKLSFVASLTNALVSAPTHDNHMLSAIDCSATPDHPTHASISVLLRWMGNSLDDDQLDVPSALIDLFFRIPISCSAPPASGPCFQSIWRDLVRRCGELAHKSSRQDLAERAFSLVRILDKPPSKLPIWPTIHRDPPFSSLTLTLPEIPTRSSATLSEPQSIHIRNSATSSIALRRPAKVLGILRDPNSTLKRAARVQWRDTCNQGELQTTRLFHVEEHEQVPHNHVPDLHGIQQHDGMMEWRIPPPVPVCARPYLGAFSSYPLASTPPLQIQPPPQNQLQSHKNSPSSPLLTSFREVPRDVQLHFDLANDRRQFAAGPGSQLVRAGTTPPPQPEPQQWSFAGLAGLLPSQFGHFAPNSAHYPQQQQAPRAPVPLGFPQGMPQLNPNMFGTSQFPATMFPPQWGTWQGAVGPSSGSSGHI